MTLPILSCGIFKYELASIRGDLERELGVELSERFLPPALDLDFYLLERTLRGEVRQPTALLYGCMCHPSMGDIASQLNSKLPRGSNCRELFISDARRNELTGNDNVFFLTLGGLKQWRDIYIDGHGWDEVDGRMNFGYIDKVILLDSGVVEYTDEELFEFYEFTQTPVEVEQIDLEFFKQGVLDMCRTMMED